ncbi:protein kinase domain-containing protein [Krasilnikovia sp. MM14-A1259]|uniref:serine/threonine-protein kinase n=1 Tax=Krasilnikovia sp. MM14-A1259 TaxID=3373539 RepID=UPI00399D4253
MEAEQILGGRYTLLDELGRGGMAVVWRAHDQVLGRAVAVKVLAGRHAPDPQSRARIRTEARAAATLSHPNIAQIHDYGESVRDGQCVPYVVMELIEGETLQQRVTAGMLSPREVFRICGQVAAGLAAAHADGLVHRDIKPANVIVTASGAKVVDFGIAATAGPAGEPEGELLGTPAYLAPERLTGDTVEPASDVYALGVLLYRLLAGASPWSVESTTQLLSAHIYVEPSPLPELPRVPEFVVDLVNRCLRKDPTERPTAADAAAILARAERLTAPAGLPDRAASLAAIPVVRTPAVPPRSSSAPVTGPPVETPGADAAPPPTPGAGVAPGRDRTRDRRGRSWYLLAGAGAGATAVAALALWQSGRLGAERTVERAAPPWVSPGGSVAPGQRPGTVPPGTARPTPGGSRATVIGAVPVGELGRMTAVPPGAPGTHATTTTPGHPRTAPPGTTPPQVPPTTPVTEPTTGPPVRTLSSDGGSVEASCADGQARLVSWSPVKPYKVDGVDAGPADAATIVFKHGNQRITMTVTCRNGSPSAAVS